MTAASPPIDPTAGRTGPDVELPAWWIGVLVGVLSLVCGVLALAWPGPTLLLVGLVFGIGLVFSGIGTLLDAIKGSHSKAGHVLLGLLGVLTILAGLILVVRPGASVVTAAFVLGFFFALEGLLQLTRGFAEREQRLFNLAFGLLGLVLGLIILASPGIGVVTLVWLVGLGFIFRGVLYIAAGFAIKRITKEA